MWREAQPLSATASPQGIRKGEPLLPTTTRQDRESPAAASPLVPVGIGQFVWVWRRSSCGPPLGSKAHSFHGNGVGRATIHAKRAANAAILILQDRRIGFPVRAFTQLRFHKVGQVPRLVKGGERDNL